MEAKIPKLGSALTIHFQIISNISFSFLSARMFDILNFQFFKAFFFQT